MAGWFAKLMQQGHAPSRRAIAGPEDSRHSEVESGLDARRARYDAIIEKLRDRVAEDRDAREKRQRGYKQTLDSDFAIASLGAVGSTPTRLHRFRTKVPCRVTPEARALLEDLRKRFPGGAVTFPHVTSGRQPVMLEGSADTWPKQIGWVESCVQTDPKLCNVRHQGLSVETDDGAMLVLRFRYPATAVRVSSRQNAVENAPSCNVTSVDFSEVRPALDLRPSEKSAAPRLVWFRRSEVETINAVGSRDYEAFYVRFKLEVLAGIWSSLSAVLADMPDSMLHGGSCYTVVREADAGSGRIYQRTLDDSGRAVDIGFNRIYNAASATDILLIYLEGDILADCADIYFALQNLGSSDAYFLKEELFAIIRRFWASSQSLASDFGSDLAAIVRMSQRALPTPAQAPLLKQDWTNLRQSLVDRYGETGRKAPDLVGQDVYRSRASAAAWPFASYPAGEVNVGLRLVYRQEWRYVGAQRGEVIRTAAAPSDLTSIVIARDGDPARGAESNLTVLGNTTRNLDSVVNEVVKATAESMKWPLDFEGSINIGLRGLAATTDMGLDEDCRESSRETSARLSDIVHKLARKIRDETPEKSIPESPSGDGETVTDQSPVTCVYSRLQHCYEILTRAAEIQNVVLVAEKLPAPAEIDLSWVRRHDWILATVLLDETFRDALETIGEEARSEARRVDLDAKRERLYGHLRSNILHYQRAIWQQEDPQQRTMRYRKSGKKVPLEWRFELESGGALSIDQLFDRLAATNVDGQFVVYSPGREADIDQVIDPAGPIGYYGNYAVYRMRAELGSEDLFSMLHFFKSPYLRANPETGEAELEDPLQIQLSEYPAIASDLFFRERARRITLDTNGVVIDVVQRAESVDVAAPSFDEPDPCEAPDGYELILNSGHDVALLNATAHPDREAWSILRREDRSSTLRTGQPHDPEADEAIRLRIEDGLRLASDFGRAAAPDDGAILPRRDDERIAAVSAGRSPDPEAERVIHPKDVRALTLNSVVTLKADEAFELGIVAKADESPVPNILAGVGTAGTDERIIHARDEESLPLASPAGAGGSLSDEQLVLARTDEALTLIVGSGQTRVHDAERLILARGDGTLRLTSVASGGAAEADEQVIVVGGGGERTPNLLAGAGAGRAHKRLILVQNDEWLRPSLVAG